MDKISIYLVNLDEIMMEESLDGKFNSRLEALSQMAADNSPGWEFKGQTIVGGVIVCEFRSDRNHLALCGIGPNVGKIRRAIRSEYDRLMQDDVEWPPLSDLLWLNEKFDYTGGK